MSRLEMIPLASFMAVKNGTVNPRNYPDEIFDLYSIPAFDAGKSELKIGREIGSPKQVVQPGDVLLSKIVPHIRRCWIVGKNQGKRIVASGEWIVFRPAGEIDEKYLRHILIGDAFHAQFMNTVAGVGGSLIRARPAFVAQIEIPVPPVVEQKRIAELLDHVDALRAKRRQEISLLDDLAKSVFLDMFGDPFHNPMEWPMQALGNLFAQKPNYGTMTPASSNEGGSLCLRVANIQDWALDLRDRKYVDLDEKFAAKHSVTDGDILLARAIASQEHLGKAVVIRPKGETWAFDSHLMRIRVNPEKLDPDFLRSLLRSAGGRRLFLTVTRRSSVQFNINSKELAALRVPLPPIERQREYVRRLAAMESVRALHRSSLAELDALFVSLRTRAFQGELLFQGVEAVV